MDLFTADHTPYTPTQEDALRTAMRKQWECDQETVKARHAIPDWIGEPRPLSKDRAAMLELLYDVGCIEWNGSPSRNNAIVAAKVGKPIAHIKGLLEQMRREGLVSSRVWDGKPVWEMTQTGEYALDEWQLDREMGII